MYLSHHFFKGLFVNIKQVFKVMELPNKQIILTLKVPFFALDSKLKNPLFQIHRVSSITPTTM